MRKFLASALCALVGLCSFHADAKLVLGTYNIRMRTLTDLTEDPATNRFWDVRADAVCRTIKDAGFDAVAINELTDDVSYDNHSMLQDIEAAFTAPDWALVTASSIPFDRKKTTIHAIIYRPAVLEVLDQGFFYHSPATDRYASDVWDMGNKARGTLWAKFRVKESGEIFYFMETHLHHTGDMARNEGSRLNVDLGRKIAGPYPVFICGDHNGATSRKPFYDLYSAFFADSRSVAEKTDGSFGTFSGWLETQTSRLDYIWVRRARVTDYKVINEKYDLGFAPSDHLPVRIEVELEAPLTTQRRYVDASAPAGGDGSETAPFATIEDGIAASCDGDTLMISAGEYELASTLMIDRSLCLLGGYKADFSETEGKTVLKGNGSESVVTVDSHSAVHMAGFEICGGKSGGNGGGINCMGPRLTLADTDIHDNYAEAYGGGVYAYGQLVAEGCRFYNNEAKGAGGGAYTDCNGSVMPWAHTFANTSFTNNSAMAGSAAYVKSTLWLDVRGCSFESNNATGKGTLAITGNKAVSTLSFYNNTFVNNNAAAAGSAIAAWSMKSGAGLALTSNTIAGNKSATAAVDIDATVSLYLNNNILACNLAGDSYCDVAAADASTVVRDKSKYNIFSTKTSVSHAPESSDRYASSDTEAATWLGAALDCSLSGLELTANTALNGGTTPTVAILYPHFGTTALNSLKTTRFVETTVMTDLNGDRQIHKENSNDTDQRGVARSTTGSASYGAYEFVDESSVAAPGVSESASAEVEYYTLQGIKVAGRPARGIYLRRCGNQVSKIIIR